MNSRKIVMRVIYVLLFVIWFNVIYFLATGAQGNASRWLGYAFVHISYATLPITAYALTRRQSPELDMPLYTISTIYFGVCFLISLIFILVNAESVKAEVVIQLTLFVVYLLFLLANLRANDVTQEQTQRRAGERRYVMECSGRLKGLMEQTTDRNFYQQLEKAYDAVRTSPIKSDERVAEQELTVLRLIAALEEEMAEENIGQCEKFVQRIIAVAGERNRMLRAR